MANILPSGIGAGSASDSNFFTDIASVVQSVSSIYEQITGKSGPTYSQSPAPPQAPAPVPPQVPAPAQPTKMNSGTALAIGAVVLLGALLLLRN